MSNKENLRSRFKDAPWFPKEETNVIIGGAGGIGSWLALCLTRAGFVPVIYDFDSIEEHNIGGQLFSKKHIGKKKVTAIAEIVRDFSDIDIVSKDEKYVEGTMSHEYVFSAFDNMQARKDMFNNWNKFVESNKDNSEIKPVFIDGRLTAEQVQIFCVTPENIEEYEKHLFDDSEVADAPC